MAHERDCSEDERREKREKREKKEKDEEAVDWWTSAALVEEQSKDQR